MVRNFFLVSILVLIASSINVLSQVYTADCANSRLEWEGRKVLGKHGGIVNIKSGTFEKNGTAYKGTFEIDMTTIAITDIKDKESNDKLIGHLKSDEFFSVNKHKTAKLIITKMEEAKGRKGANYKVTGNLTIKGKTNEIVFPAKIEFVDKTMNASAEFTIDRTKWDVQYGSGSFFDNLGDKAIENDIYFKLKLVAITK